MSLREVSQYLDRRPVLVDTAFAAVLAIPSAIVQSSAAYSNVYFDGNGVMYGSHDSRLWALWGLLYCIPLVLRRSRPELAATLLMIPHLFQLFAYRGVVFANVTVLVMMFTLALHSKRYRIWLGVGLGAAGLAGISWGVGILAGRTTSVSFFDVVAAVGLNFLMCALAVVVAWTLGRLVYHRSETTQAIRAEKAAITREREQVRELAGEQERSRIAREMHDVIAHSLSVIIVQSDGAKYLLQSQHADPKVVNAVDVIGITAREALGETRRLVGVLRHGSDAGPEYEPAVGLADIPNLVQRTAQAGQPVTLDVRGDPRSHPPLSAGAQAAAYRVVQESLTNVMKHAGPNARCHVTLQHSPAGLWLQVVDDGVGHTPNDGTGHGIIGMHERIAAFGGTLVAQERFDGGFEVRAQLPATQWATQATR